MSTLPLTHAYCVCGCAFQAHRQHLDKDRTDSCDLHGYHTMQRIAGPERLTYRLEGVVDMGEDCSEDASCRVHYVVRDRGIWVHSFHNEKDAQDFGAHHA